MLNSGDSLSGFTINGDVTISKNGNPGNCVYIPGGGNIYKDYDVLAQNPLHIYFDVKLVNQTMDFMFLANKEGVGPFFCLSSTAQYAYFNKRSAGWADYSGGVSGGVPWGAALPCMKIGKWYKFRIDFDWASSKLSLVWINDGVEQLVIKSANFSPKGTYLGWTGDYVGSGGGAIDNFGILATSNISGKALLSNGAPATEVQIYSWADHRLYATATPDASGGYSSIVEAGDYLLVAVGPDGFRPSAHKVTV